MVILPFFSNKSQTYYSSMPLRLYQCPIPSPPAHDMMTQRSNEALLVFQRVLIGKTVPDWLEIEAEAFCICIE
jgi:hypothetical protein